LSVPLAFCVVSQGPGQVTACITPGLVLKGIGIQGDSGFLSAAENKENVVVAPSLSR